MDIKNEVTRFITLDLFNKCPEEPLDVLRHYFTIFAENSQFLTEGLKFFSLFPDIIKMQKFNSVKAFLFYFAYQTNKFNTPLVKELLGQTLINANIFDPKIYLEFCMYCFYKGLYYIEKKNYFMASYVYAVPVSMGLGGNPDDTKVLNHFSMQMIRSLCFLKSLSDFDIKNYLFSGRAHGIEDALSIDYDDMNKYLGYIRNEPNNLENFLTFIKANKDLEKNYKLFGLKNEAEEALILKKVKENLGLYKRIKMTKLIQLTKVEFKDLMRVLKKKVLDGEINVKYDEDTEIVEVFDLDPGLREQVQKTKELYKNIVEGNKNLFITLRDKKVDELNGRNHPQEEDELRKRRLFDKNEEGYAGEMELDD